MLKRLSPILLILFFACDQADDGKWKAKIANADYLHRNIKAITDRIVHDIFSPPVASRIYAYISVAAYEAARHTDPELVSLVGQLKGLTYMPAPEPNQVYSYELASVQASYKVGRTLIFSESELDAVYRVLMTEIKEYEIPKDVYHRSIAYGDTIAASVMAWAGKDNYKQSRSFPKYSIQDDPGTWKPTPPAYMDAVEPHWNKIRTFVTDSAQQFRPQGPVAFSTKKGSDFYKIAEEVYNIGKGLTAQQEEISRFWDCNPFVMNVNGHVMFANKKISPGGHWMNITRVACEKTKASMALSAEAYVRVSISLIEGFINCWDEKYRSVLIRPENYINQYIDENWLPLLQTPPFPEHTSGHSTISGCAATALTVVFGDNFAFTDSTEVEYGMTARSFTSFQQAADEASISRVYGGIHYRPAVDIGIATGRKLGEFVNNKIVTRKKVMTQAN
jgi:PAP2 superfamily